VVAVTGATVTGGGRGTDKEVVVAWLLIVAGGCSSFPAAEGSPSLAVSVSESL